MPQRPLSQCRHAGCSVLVQGRGYCPEHTHDVEARKRERFEKIDARKTPESKRFYSSAAWQKARALHLSNEPLCRRCKAEGKIRIAGIVHHDPTFEELVSGGLNPLNDEYLESICIKHHQQELSRKVNHGPN